MTSAVGGSSRGSSSSSNSSSIPIQLLYEAEGLKITVEMKNGTLYRGLLLGAESTMNMTLSQVLCTSPTGQVVAKNIETVYLRGSGIRFIALPDILKSAPLFHNHAVALQKHQRKLLEQQQQHRNTNRHDSKRKRGG